MSVEKLKVNKRLIFIFLLKMVTVKISEKSISSLEDNLYIADYKACLTSFNFLTTPAYYNDIGIVITAYAVMVP